MSGAALNNPGGGGVSSNKQTIWHTLAQTAPDQLRQRAAWAFSQIFALGVISSSSMFTIVEHWTVFYGENLFRTVYRSTGSDFCNQRARFMRVCVSVSVSVSVVEGEREKRENIVVLR